MSWVSLGTAAIMAGGTVGAAALKKNGGGNKGGSWDVGQIYGDVPKLNLQGYDVWLRQIDDLIQNWDDIKTGKSMFDAVKFIYEPQRTSLEQAYGLGAPGVLSGQNSLGESNDLFARGGTIPRTLAQMNATGTLDSGGAGVVRGQLESQMNKDLAGLFGQAKQTQRQDYFTSLEQLKNLYPERFEVLNIPNYLNYFNATNGYNAGLQQRALNASYGLANQSNNNAQFGNLIGTGLGYLFGGPVGGAVGGQIGGQVFGGGGSAPRTTYSPSSMMPLMGGGNGGGMGYGQTGSASLISGENPIAKTGGNGLDFSKLLQAMGGGLSAANFTM
jgi:hypothetical protein